MPKFDPSAVKLKASGASVSKFPTTTTTTTSTANASTTGMTLFYTFIILAYVN